MNRAIIKAINPKRKSNIKNSLNPKKWTKNFPTDGARAKLIMLKIPNNPIAWLLFVAEDTSAIMVPADTKQSDSANPCSNLNKGNK